MLAEAIAGSLGNKSSAYMGQIMAVWSLSSVHRLDESPDLALRRFSWERAILSGARPAVHRAALAASSR